MSRRKAAAARAQRLSRPVGPRGPSEELVAKRDGQWWVRTQSGASATKTYTCPGCSRPIPSGAAHVVAWPQVKSLLSDEAIDERRHWHTACWRRKV